MNAMFAVNCSGASSGASSGDSDRGRLSAVEEAGRSVTMESWNKLGCKGPVDMTSQFDESVEKVLVVKVDENPFLRD